jgi:hypothetical protein
MKVVAIHFVNFDKSIRTFIMNRDFAHHAHRRTSAAIRHARFNTMVSLQGHSDDMTPEELAVVAATEVRDISMTDTVRRLVLSRFPDFQSLFTMEHVFTTVVEDFRRCNVSVYGYSAEAFTRELQSYFGNDLVIDDETFPEYVASLWDSRSGSFDYRCVFAENAETMQWVEHAYRMIALCEEEMQDARSAGDFHGDLDMHPFH